MKKIIFTIISVIFFSFSACTDLEPTWYSEVTPQTFFKTKEDVYSAMGRPFTHLYASEMRGDGVGFWFLQELCADHFAVIQKEQKWTGGDWFRFQNHDWGTENPFINNAWSLVTTGVALSLEVIEDLKAADFSAMGLTEEDRAADIAQMRTLVAYFYLRGLDFYGGMPLYESTAEEPKARATTQDTFLFIEELLKQSLEVLPMKDENTEIDYTINRGAAAVLLARLYFNAMVYCGEDHFNDCATLCQEILDGKYGHYEIVSDWREPFGFNNLKSIENIWVLPSALNKLQNNTYAAWFYQPNMMYDFFGLKGAGTMNGITLMPSHKPNGSLYTEADFHLGRLFSKFEGTDTRKVCYKYNGNGNYDGQMLFGKIQKNGNPIIVSGQSSVYDGKPLELVDYVGRVSLIGATYGSADDLPSTKYDGEENTGVRLIKYPIAPDDDPYQWTAGFVMARLVEVQYMLAECKWRLGDKEEAATLINSVRKRNFANGNDPNPCSSSNLDKWRMLDEWGLEFMGEGRRRTDLLRWEVFVEEDWWDHKATKQAYLKLFPVPTEVMGGNPLISQNPGYN
ncbi:MAG: hypothetical protein BGO34_13240 [Bacteroidia bacterium 44-10]|nr:MAG: hypothetical protein BGO34_13240 [Bacteroidia bacterium 44-10]